MNTDIDDWLSGLVVVNMDLSNISKIIGHFLFQKKGQLGHPDEIRAKKISLGWQMTADLHGLKKKVCFAFGEISLGRRRLYPDDPVNPV